MANRRLLHQTNVVVSKAYKLRVSVQSHLVILHVHPDRSIYDLQRLRIFRGEPCVPCFHLTPFPSGRLPSCHAQVVHTQAFQVSDLDCKRTSGTQWNHPSTLLITCLPRLTAHLAFASGQFALFDRSPQEERCGSTCEHRRTNALLTHPHVAMSNKSIRVMSIVVTLHHRGQQPLQPFRRRHG